MSYSRKACRTFFSNEQLAEVRFNFENVRNYFYSSVFDIDFSANILASCEDSLTVQFTEEAVGEVSYEWDFDNDGVIDDTTANPTHTYLQAGAYDVRLW
jgi:PKD repeat protein